MDFSIRFQALQKLPPRRPHDEDGFLADIRSFAKTTGDPFGVTVVTRVGFEGEPEERVHYALASGREARQIFQHYLNLALTHYPDPLPDKRVVMEQFEAASMSLLGKLKGLSNKILAAKDLTASKKQGNPDRELEVEGLKINDLSNLNIWAEEEGLAVRFEPDEMIDFFELAPDQKSRDALNHLVHALMEPVD